MAVSVACKRCMQLITAVNEEDLLAQVEAHARDHGGAHGTHIPTREHVLGHLEKHEKDTDTRRS
jgi:hypothetical protein